MPAQATSIPAGLPGQFYSFDISSLNLEVPAGEVVYIGPRWNAAQQGALLVCSDESVTTPLAGGYGYSNFTGETLPIQNTFGAYRALFIRADGVEGLGLADSRATFEVTKDFTDDNPNGIEVTISCNTGLPLEQTKVITEEDGVEFVVTDFDSGELDCEITEDSPGGYLAEYDLGIGTTTTGCEFTSIEAGDEFSCAITNTPAPVGIDIFKEWVFEGSSDPQGVDQRFELTLYCDSQIVDGYQFGAGVEDPQGPIVSLCGLFFPVGGGQSSPGEYADWCKSFSGEGSDQFTAEVIPEWPDSHCYVVEHLFDDAVEGRQRLPEPDGQRGSGSGVHHHQYRVLRGHPGSEPHGPGHAGAADARRRPGYVPALCLIHAVMGKGPDTASGRNRGRVHLPEGKCVRPLLTTLACPHSPGVFALPRPVPGRFAARCLASSA